MSRRFLSSMFLLAAVLIVSVSANFESGSAGFIGGSEYLAGISTTAAAIHTYTQAATIEILLGENVIFDVTVAADGFTMTDVVDHAKDDRLTVREYVTNGNKFISLEIAGLRLEDNLKQIIFRNKEDHDDKTAITIGLSAYLDANATSIPKEAEDGKRFAVIAHYRGCYPAGTQVTVKCGLSSNYDDYQIANVNMADGTIQRTSLDSSTKIPGFGTFGDITVEWKGTAIVVSVEEVDENDGGDRTCVFTRNEYDKATFSPSGSGKMTFNFLCVLITAVFSSMHILNV